MGKYLILRNETTSNSGDFEVKIGKVVEAKEIHNILLNKKIPK